MRPSYTVQGDFFYWFRPEKSVEIVQQNSEKIENNTGSAQYTNKG